MGSTIASIFLTSGFIVGAFGYAALIILTFLLPFMAWSATRNLKLIRQQLELLNETLASRGPGRSGGPLGI